ncbi:hypothetical protein [uncultured Methanoregula sp.]|uniref:hypothetical protein n=1 Tax=uncultured Methanoregula sp. TaxID=1005933 RepID=UPI002AABFD50|nr:hypothetical protein [uncultured Methanoregula sp.]
MEKIQIQFKESDYKVYYEYCERYYQIHDIVRKKSILTFLDLFSKGVLNVAEQDISQVTLLLSQKCEELKKSSYDNRGDGDTTTSLQLESCADILHFSKDLEKMYRLFQKQGLVANYLLIIGTFSKVTDAAKNSPVNVMYNLDNETIESLSLPLVDLIRGRLGTDREWRSVLRELNVIAARYNRVASGPKFDLDTIKLVAPAVVYHFNKDVKTSEIISVVPSYFDECELDEFETLLNRTSQYLQDELDADIDWQKIAGPLKIIAAKVDEQREEWKRERSKLEDHYSLASPADMLASEGTTSSAGSVSSAFPGSPRVNELKGFEINMSPDGTTGVESPLQIYTEVKEDSPKPAIVTHLPIVIGICIIVAFIFGSVILSGAWNPLDMGNSTQNGTYPNGTVIKPAATTAKPAATTAKPAATTAAPAATTAKPAVTTVQASYSSADVGSHLLEIGFGPDNNVIQKPTKDLLGISLMGADKDSDVAVITNFINQFNNYSSTTKISTNIDTTSPSADITLVFLPESSLRQLNVDANTLIVKDIQTGTYYFVRTTTTTFGTSNQQTYVNADLKGNTRARWILRALLYTMGFKGETAKYTDSLFYSGATDAKQASQIDLKAIQLMFGKKVTNGMTKAQIKELY